MTADATALADAIRAGRTTAAAAMEASLAAAARFEHLGAIRLLDARMARDLAADFDRRLVHGDALARTAPFGGVPFLMKDLGAAAAGLPKAAGCRFLARHPIPAGDDLLTMRLRAAGLLPYGLTTVPEFGLALSSEPPTGPLARNPLNEALTPGGSSGGAGAAVAAGIVALAHATDAAGSTRVPAACCGLVGLKATRGAMPTGPDFGNHLFGVASELVVSRSVRDSAAALVALSGRAGGPLPDPDLRLATLADLDAPLPTLRVGVFLEAPDVGVTAERMETVAAAADRLARAGHKVTRLDADICAEPLAKAQQVFATIILANFARNLGAVVDGLAEDDVSVLARHLIVEGRAMPAAALVEADLAAAKIAHALWRFFEGFDVILTPMLSGPPLPVGAFPLDHTDAAAHWRRMADFAPYAAIANVGGIPAITFPHGEDGDGLPLPVQVLGPMGSDALLLRVARLFEREAPWRFRFPIAGLPESEGAGPGIGAGAGVGG